MINLSYNTLDQILTDWYSSTFPDSLKSIMFNDDNEKEIQFTVHTWDDETSTDFTTKRSSVTKDELKEFLIKSL